MKLIFAAALAASIMLSGCAGTRFNFDDARQVKIGMTEDQVVALLGRPYMVNSRGDTQVWVWSHANGITGGGGAVAFGFKDGKVVQVPTIPASFK